MNHTTIRNNIVKALRKIKQRYKPEKMILFGSFARGDYNEASDVDVLMIKKSNKRFIDRSEDVLALSDGKIQLEPIVYTPEEFKKIKDRNFIKTILKEGIRI